MILLLPRLIGLALTVQGAAAPIPIGSLTQRPDLVGKEIVVEGRKPHFEYQRTHGWNRFDFPGSPVEYHLPDPLAFKAPPNFPVLRVRGILSRQGSRFVCEVIQAEPLAADLDRLKTGVAALPAEDVNNRQAWARWGEQRAAEYDDEALAAEARRVLGDALWNAASQPSNSAPNRLVELAREARERKVPEPIPSALAHGGLHKLLGAVKSAAEAVQLARQAEAFFPQARPAAPPADLAAWLVPYDADPAATYRKAPGPLRAALDRKLLADLLQRAFERQVAEHPQEALTLADQALTQLPDRPEVSVRLRRQGLESTDVSALRLAEIQERARQFERLGETEAARNLLKRWLDDQRANRLSATDAEGRLLLAGQYEQLIGDKTTAASLLLEAWKIDPESQRIVDEMERRGFRKVKGDWEPPADRTASRPGSPDTVVSARADSLVGRSRDDVRSLLGRPNHIARVATQGQVIEQWIYTGDAKRPSQYINFLIRPGTSRASVIAHGSMRSSGT